MISFMTENASVHNFADDNTLSRFAKTVKVLINILKEESEFAINWFSSNEMIVNPDKFKSVILTKKQIRRYTSWVFYWYRYCLHREICKT